LLYGFFEEGEFNSPKTLRIRMTSSQWFWCKTADDGKQRKTSGHEQFYSHVVADSWTSKWWYMARDSIWNPNRLQLDPTVKNRNQVPMM
jgi:hypothetical protein